MAHRCGRWGPQAGDCERGLVTNSLLLLAVEQELPNSHVVGKVRQLVSFILVLERVG